MAALRSGSLVTRGGLKMRRARLATVSAGVTCWGLLRCATGLPKAMGRRAEFSVVAKAVGWGNRYLPCGVTCDSCIARVEASRPAPVRVLQPTQRTFIILVTVARRCPRDHKIRIPPVLVVCPRYCERPYRCCARDRAGRVRVSLWLWSRSPGSAALYMR